MRKLFLIAVLCVIGSCGHENNYKVKEPAVVFEAEVHTPDVNKEKEVFGYQVMATQKLQDYFDLALLKENFPDFKDNIDTQLNKLINDTTSIPEEMTKVHIKNVQQIGKDLVISDSIKMIRLSFDIVSNGLIRKDTITAEVSTRRISIGDENVIGTKMRFLRD
ncbi:MAG: hypothetical protein AB3N16_12925 [Flavobacteriaceae bacterium]